MSQSVDLDDLLTNEEAAALLGIKPNTLEIWRHKGRGPEFIKLGNTPQSAVRYLRSRVMAFCQRRTFANTSAYSAAALASSKQHNGLPTRASG